MFHHLRICTNSFWAEGFVEGQNLMNPSIRSILFLIHVETCIIPCLLDILFMLLQQFINLTVALLFHKLYAHMNFHYQFIVVYICILDKVPVQYQLVFFILWMKPLTLLEFQEMTWLRDFVISSSQCVLHRRLHCLLQTPLLFGCLYHQNV